MKHHTRHEHISKTGARISRGGWERLNRVYNVHHVKTARYRTGRFDDKGNEIILSKKSYTYTLHPETPKAFRKLGMRERFAPEGTKRARYSQNSVAGTTK